MLLWYLLIYEPVFCQLGLYALVKVVEKGRFINWYLISIHSMNLMTFLKKETSFYFYTNVYVGFTVLRICEISVSLIFLGVN
jgi:hypothetical protein